MGTQGKVRGPKRKDVSVGKGLEKGWECGEKDYFGERMGVWGKRLGWECGER
jgi:hypothetical protein